jgi:hypothetical protein
MPPRGEGRAGLGGYLENTSSRGCFGGKRKESSNLQILDQKRKETPQGTINKAAARATAVHGTDLSACHSELKHRSNYIEVSPLEPSSCNIACIPRSVSMKSATVHLSSALRFLRAFVPRFTHTLGRRNHGHNASNMIPDHGHSSLTAHRACNPH